MRPLVAKAACAWNRALFHSQKLDIPALYLKSRSDRRANRSPTYDLAMTALCTCTAAYTNALFKDIV
jgi:hypothetical protein